MLQFSRIRLSSEADSRLKMLKARTGLAPNLLCRVALCVSLNEPTPPDPRAYQDESGREMNRVTLFGQWDEAYCRLIEHRIWEYGMPPEVADAQVAAHVNRGVALLSQRLHGLDDLTAVLEDVAHE